RIRHIVANESTMPTSLTFKWAGWLSSCLEISLGRCGASGKDDVRNAVANLLTAVTISLDCSDGYTAYAKNCRLPVNGLRTLLDPDYELKFGTKSRLSSRNHLRATAWTLCLP